MEIDKRTFEIEVNKCPLCGGSWRYYNGCLGYESLVCEVCRFDIKEIKIVEKKYDKKY